MKQTILFYLLIIVTFFEESMHCNLLILSVLHYSKGFEIELNCKRKWAKKNRNIEFSWDYLKRIQSIWFELSVSLIYNCFFYSISDWYMLCIWFKMRKWWMLLQRDSDIRFSIYAIWHKVNGNVLCVLFDAEYNFLTAKEKYNKTSNPHLIGNAMSRTQFKIAWH